MGTNYYLMVPVRIGPNRWHIPGHLATDESQDPGELHIGKSSGGWCFSLHIIPELGIMTLADWKAKWPEGVILNEYNDVISIEEMANVIEDRSGVEGYDYAAHPVDIAPYMVTRYRYADESDFHRRNHSQRGPNNLLRHRIGRFCVGHGEGTWDLMPGEFC